MKMTRLELFLLCILSFTMIICGVYITDVADSSIGLCLYTVGMLLFGFFLAIDERKEEHK